MSNPAYWGESWTDEMKAKGVMLALEGVGRRLGFTGRTIFTPSDYANLVGGTALSDLQRKQLDRMAGLGQYTYGQPPQQTSDWDKFLQFNAIVAPVLGQVLGTWIQGRYQAQTAAQQNALAQQMAKNFDSMSEEQQTQVMEAYLANKAAADAGYRSGMDSQSLNVLGSAFNMANQGNVSNAYNNAFANLSQAAGGNVSILNSLQRSGTSLKASSAVSIPTWLLLAGGAAAVWYFAIRPKQAPMAGMKRW